MILDYNKTKVVQISLNDILPNRFQPRIKFNEQTIIELSESIKKHGVIQPIIVRPIGDRFEIIAGERRYKGSLLAGLNSIPAIVVDSNDKESAEIALLENVQREDLNPIEEALSYEKILGMGYLTQEQLAEKLGVSQSAIANKKRLLNLSDDAQEALMEIKISERHARSLLKITNDEDQVKMLKKIIADRLTVRQLDLKIDELLSGNREYIEQIKLESKREEDLDTEEEIDLSSLFSDIDFSKLDFNESEKEEEKKVMNNNIFYQPTNNYDNEVNNNQSMFSNFDVNNDNEKIDEKTFKNLLDPSFVDGQTIVNNDNNDGEALFSKFISSNDENLDNSSNLENNISGIISSQTNADNVEDFFNNQKENKLEPIKFNDMIETQPEIPESNFRPDLLSPMKDISFYNNLNNNVEAVKEIEPMIEEKEINPIFEPIDFVGDNHVDEVIKETQSISENNLPSFITASSKDDIDIPVTNPIEEDITPPQDEIGEAITAEIEESTSEEVVTDNIEKTEQTPIIIADYNKQYDPVIPKQDVEPKVSINYVINMIRQLNDKIENMGFKIDTEEYDLEDVYQVIIRIDK